MTTYTCVLNWIHYLTEKWMSISLHKRHKPATNINMMCPNYIPWYANLKTVFNKRRGSVITSIHTIGY